MNEQKKGFEFDQNVADQLNRLFRTEALKKLREEYFKLFRVNSGEHILDSGCGMAANATALLEHLNGKCRITGIDNSEPMLAIGRQNIGDHRFGKNIELRYGDSHELAFPDDTFDAAMLIQVLEYSKEPIRMLNETKRAIKAGGRIFVADTDWDTLVWNSNQKEKTRKIVLEWSDHEADGWQGRRIYEYLKKAGFNNIEGGVYPMFETSFNPDSYSFLLTRLITEYLQRTEKMAGLELENWIEDLKDKDRSGHFYFSLNRYAFVARK